MLERNATNDASLHAAFPGCRPRSGHADSDGRSVGKLLRSISREMLAKDNEKYS